MKKQYVEGVQKQKKKEYLNKVVITMLALMFNGKERDTTLTVKKTEIKEDANKFLNLHVAAFMPPNEHS